MLRGEWEPAGVPTIFKLIEVLDQELDELQIIFTAKELRPCHEIIEDRDIGIRNLNANVKVLAGEEIVPAIFGRWRWWYNEFRQFCCVLKIYRRMNPDLLYIDRGNIFSAGIFARFFRTPVIYRVMGISPALRSIWKGYKPRQILLRWLLRSPFSHVICTEEGSGGELWLKRLLDPLTNRDLLLNGVDRPDPDREAWPSLFKSPDGKVVVLFLGRLDALKGGEHFIQGFLAARQKLPDKIHALVIGDGPQRVNLDKVVSSADACDDVTFLGHVPHSQVGTICKKADIYVSLNQMGNLSNATLEAMAAGLCLIMPSSREDIGADMLTDTFLPEDVVVRIPSPYDTAALAQAIVNLTVDAMDRNRRQIATQAIADQMLPTWAERIKTELKLLKKLAAPRSAS